MLSPAPSVPCYESGEPCFDLKILLLGLADPFGHFCFSTSGSYFGFPFLLLSSQSGLLSVFSLIGVLTGPTSFFLSAAR